MRIAVKNTSTGIVRNTKNLSGANALQVLLGGVEEKGGETGSGSIIVELQSWTKGGKRTPSQERGRECLKWSRKGREKSEESYSKREYRFEVVRKWGKSGLRSWS